MLSRLTLLSQSRVASRSVAVVATENTQFSKPQIISIMVLYLSSCIIRDEKPFVPNKF